MPDIALRFGKDMLVCEGAMGTMLLKAGMPAGECPEYLNVLDPEMVGEIHRYYRMAGANVAISNTFGGTRSKLEAYGLGDRVEELNMAGVAIARQAQPEHVIADVGPCGLLMQPMGSATFEEESRARGDSHRDDDGYRGCALRPVGCPGCLRPSGHRHLHVR